MKEAINDEDYERASELRSQFRAIEKAEDRGRAAVIRSAGWAAGNTASSAANAGIVRHGNIQPAVIP